MNSTFDPIDFARASAAAARDQVSAWGSLQESADNYRDNLIDTLADNRVTDQFIIANALATFDALVKA